MMILLRKIKTKTMEKKIFLPNPEQAGAMIEYAWNNFCAFAREHGLMIDDKFADGLLKDCFAAGYSYGSNDMLGIVRDQLNAEQEANNIINNL